MKTTFDLSDALMEEAKRIAAREGVTVKSIVEAGLREQLAHYHVRRAPFTLRDASVGGKGLQPEVQGQSWEAIRDLGYEGRGT